MPNIGDRIIEYSRPRIERMVDAFIKERPFIGSSPPVVPDLILGKMPEVSAIETDMFLAEKFHIEAMVLTATFMHRDLKVVVDESLLTQPDEAPFNMAMAEEIGHIELHRQAMLDMQEPEDFLELQRHPRWAIAERDARHFGRALLMPREMLERFAKETYSQLAQELEFGNYLRFHQMFVARMAARFIIPVADAYKRIESYTGGLSTRLANSFANCELDLRQLFINEVDPKMSAATLAEWIGGTPQ